MPSLLPGRWGLLALLGPFLLAPLQAWFIPSWYQASLPVSFLLLLLNGAAVAAGIRACLRRPGWGWPRRIGASLGLLSLAVAAAVVCLVSGMREGMLMCGRELDRTVDCPGGGQAFEFTTVCIAGNPRLEVQLRPDAWPFMYPVAHFSAEGACESVSR